MKQPIFWILLTSFFFAACSERIYVVRHAEKATAAPGSMMSSDVPLSEAGQERAELLRDILKHKSIRSIYTTQTIRTTSTAAPLSKWLNVPIQHYHARDTLQPFAQVLRTAKGSALVVGHSNTVDDLVNIIAGENLIQGDLPENVYDRMFILAKTKRGIRFKQTSFGKVYP